MATTIPVIGEQALSFNPGIVKVSARTQVTYLHSATARLLATVKANQKILVLGVLVQVTAVFNAGSTNVLKIGDSGANGRLADTADLNEASATWQAYYGKQYIYDVTSDTAINAYYTQTGGAATTGAAWIQLVYVDMADLV